jgi:hypothetical protein
MIDTGPGLKVQIQLVMGLDSRLGRRRAIRTRGHARVLCLDKSETRAFSTPDQNPRKYQPRRRRF